jgi:hypothetical protein
MTDRLDICGDDVRVAYPLFHEGGGGAIPTSPLQLDVHPVNVHTACKLNALWHSRFPVIQWSNVIRNKRYVCFVAEYEGIYWATALWSSPIAGNRLKEGASMLELRRMAIANEAPRNTASRMLKVMRYWIRENFPEITTLISYQDSEVHQGTIYKASGWTATSTSKPDTPWTDTRVRSAPQSTSAKIRWEMRVR